MAKRAIAEGFKSFVAWGDGNIRRWVTGVCGTAPAARPLTFATDFSDVGMAAFALRQLLPEKWNLRHIRACDIWQDAREFIANNHSAIAVFAGVRKRTRLRPPVALYIAPPPPPVPTLGEVRHGAGVAICSS